MAQQPEETKPLWDFVASIEAERLFVNEYTKHFYQLSQEEETYSNFFNTRPKARQYQQSWGK